MSSKVWCIGLQKHIKMIQRHNASDPHISSNSSGCVKMTEMRSIVWMTIAFGCAFA